MHTKHIQNEEVIDITDKKMLTVKSTEALLGRKLGPILFVN